MSEEITILSEETEESLRLQLDKMAKSARKMKIVEGIIENLESFNSFTSTKELPALPCFFEKDQVDNHYLWLFSRRDDESYYCGTWFDKSGKLAGTSFRATKYRLSEVARSVLSPANQS